MKTRSRSDAHQTRPTILSCGFKPCVSGIFVSRAFNRNRGVRFSCVQLKFKVLSVSVDPDVPAFAVLLGTRLINVSPPTTAFRLVTKEELDVRAGSFFPFLARLQVSSFRS
eukprot:GHVH01009406.1.p1 GENE.GHVH01009406.1~~GHVH01009406.1.p1  ORF type:complete len:111 (-),score=4.98 GHVH01009406.1:658-990(-)